MEFMSVSVDIPTLTYLIALSLFVVVISYGDSLFKSRKALYVLLGDIVTLVVVVSYWTLLELVPVKLLAAIIVTLVAPIAILSSRVVR